MSEREEKYPEHAKLRAIDPGEKRGITEFLEWLEARDLEICRHYRSHDDYLPEGYSIGKWLAMFFQIDPFALGREKEAMLEELRSFTTLPVNNSKMLGRGMPPPVTGIGDEKMLEEIRAQNFEQDLCNCDGMRPHLHWCPAVRVTS